MAKVKGKGFFRGVPFLIIEEAEQSGGHRVVQHDYPLRDTGRVQNMGRKARDTTIQVVLMGDDVYEQRDKFVEALEVSEAGELSHPDFETQLVQIVEWKQKISTKAQRMISFSITFVVADEDESPITQQNGEVTLAESTQNLVDSAASDFESFCETVGLPSSLVSETLDFAENIATTVTSAVRGVTGATGLSSILSSGLAFKSSVSNLLTSPGKVMGELSDLLSAIKAVGGSDASNSLSAIKLANSSASSNNTHTQAIQVTVNTLILANQTSLTLEEANRSVKVNAKNSDSTASIVTLDDCNQAITLLGQELLEAKINASDLYFQGTAKNINQVRQVFIEQMKLASTKLPSSTIVTNSITEATPEQLTSVIAEVEDNNINRYRPTIILFDDLLIQATGKIRADWERRRNIAHSQPVTVTVKDWFYGDGKLWAPNQLVTLNAKDYQNTELLIIDVAFGLGNEDGITTMLTLMPRDGFLSPKEIEVDKDLWIDGLGTDGYGY